MNTFLEEKIGDKDFLRFLQFKREEAEKSRKHELEMAKIYASMFGAIRGPTVSPSPPPTPPPFMNHSYRSPLPPQRFSSRPVRQNANGQYSHVDGAVYENLRSPEY